MSAALDTKFSFLNAYGGPGGRRQHNFYAEAQGAPPRTRSLPQLGAPAGLSAKLGNGLSLESYATLRGPFQARLDAPLYGPNGGRHKDVAPQRQRKVEEWVMPERVRPESLPPAGVIKKRVTGKRLIGENTNVLSHVDTLIWGVDVDGSDGVLQQAGSSIYHNSAGLNAKAERTPIYGTLPPKCVRTFGPDGSTDQFESVTYQRRDPRFEEVG
mmetsp:Transcript_4921/g.14364  ORF Transcript_4921/g.14364 Transcript_4921/m.14364 type:complete len:213 (+) Transcript_4921:87-725(+)